MNSTGNTTRCVVPLRKGVFNIANHAPKLTQREWTG
jgi:hypothetical protein